jgi:thioesterase domain-containing protein
VGVSWGGVLTLELAKLLEAQGAETRVVLLDGALETSCSMVELLGQGAKFDANLISRLLQIDNIKVNTSLHIISAYHHHHNEHKQGLGLKTCSFKA